MLNGLPHVARAGRVRALHLHNCRMLRKAVGLMLQGLESEVRQDREQWLVTDGPVSSCALTSFGGSCMGSMGLRLMSATFSVVSLVVVPMCFLWNGLHPTWAPSISDASSCSVFDAQGCAGAAFQILERAPCEGVGR